MRRNLLLIALLVSSFTSLTPTFAGDTAAPASSDNKVVEGAKKVGKGIMWGPKKIGEGLCKGAKAVGRGCKKAVGKGD